MGEDFERGKAKALAEIEDRIREYKAKYPQPGKVNIGVQVNPIQWKAFRVRCLELGRTASDVLDELIGRFLEGERS